MKASNENLILLNTLFTTALVASNVVTVKLLHTGCRLFGVDVVLPGAAICYACTFLITDVIGEIWGRKEASQSVLYGVACQLFASALFLITERLPAADPAMQEAYSKILGQNLLFAMASLVAYATSQSWDVWVFHKVRDAYLLRHEGDTSARWIWNNVSTMTSQAIDTLLFIGIVFGIGFRWLWQPDKWPALAATIAGQYLFKIILAALDTPLFYLLTRRATAPKQRSETAEKPSDMKK